MLPRGVIQSLLGWDIGLSVAERDRVDRDVASFIRAEIALAPAHLRLGIRVLAGAFTLWMVVSSLVGSEAGAAIALWIRLAGAPGGMLVRLLRSLALLAYGEHPIVRARLGEPSVAAWQRDQRLARAAAEVA